MMSEWVGGWVNEGLPGLADLEERVLRAADLARCAGSGVCCVRRMTRTRTILTCQVHPIASPTLPMVQ